MKRMLACLCTLLMLGAPLIAAAAYPEKPIRLLIGFPPGGGTDVLARTLATKLSAELGQQVIPENRPGASGIVAAQVAAGAPPDGYTIMFATSSVLAINSVTYANLPYDPVKNFAPVSLVALMPMVVAVPPSLPVKTLADLVALARSKPGGLLYGSTSGSIELAVQLFAMNNGIKMTPVLYKGATEAINDFLGGQIQLMFDPILTSYPLVQSGKARGLAVTTAERSRLTPELPSIAELKMPSDYDVAIWHSVVLPAGTPQPIVDRLNAAIVKVLAQDDLAQQFARFGAEPRSSSPAELGQRISGELARWRKTASEAGIKLIQ
ncbi:MAG: Bug family tripartite tricarboxylate transporter substrate binding protein [Lautropia sp.]